jgi:hypothetical protein
LIEALKNSFTDFGRLIDFPQKSGILEVKETQRTFQRHGMGFIFTDSKRKIIIDSHKYLSNPACFDAWRISPYLASIHWKGEKETSPSEKQKLYSESGAREWLQELEKAGIIEAIPNNQTHYRLLIDKT